LAYYQQQGDHSLRINDNIDTFTWFGIEDDDLIDYLPTNEQGADWLNRVMGDWMVRSSIPGATADEEFTDSYSSRMIWGGVNLVFGAAEIVGGIALMGGMLGIGSVAGGARTIAGFEAITQGIDFWRTPVESSHGTGLLGDRAPCFAVTHGPKRPITKGPPRCSAASLKQSFVHRAAFSCSTGLQRGQC
jgi:hypothetical protein